MSDEKSRNYLLWGILLVPALFVSLLFALIAIAVLLPAIQYSREAARREQTARNLESLRRALANYHAEAGTTLPVAPADEQ